MTDSRTNRAAKDRVFQMLFDTQEKLLELFNALEGTNYTDPQLIHKNTLSDALYNTMINDLSFSLGECYIVLTEHQSTGNENMPLRMLLYFARVVEKTLDLNELLKRKLHTMPTPRFYVLYNGTAKQPPVWEMKLSDSYSHAEAHPVLELVVKAININTEESNPILRKSPTLSGYSHLVKAIRENIATGMERDEAIDTAVKQCIEKGILVDFLKEHASEVTNAMFREITMEDALRIRGEEAWEDGMEEGIKEGLKKGLKEGLEEGRDKVNELNRLLVRDGRQDDMIQAIENTELQEQLMKEYEL